MGGHWEREAWQVTAGDWQMESDSRGLADGK